MKKINFALVITFLISESALAGGVVPSAHEFLSCIKAVENTAEMKNRDVDYAESMWRPFEGKNNVYSLQCKKQDHAYNFAHRSYVFLDESGFRRVVFDAFEDNLHHPYPQGAFYFFKGNKKYYILDTGIVNGFTLATPAEYPQKLKKFYNVRPETAAANWVTPWENWLKNNQIVNHFELEEPTNDQAILEQEASCVLGELINNVMFVYSRKHVRSSPVKVAQLAAEIQNYLPDCKNVFNGQFFQSLSDILWGDGGSTIRKSYY